MKGILDIEYAHLRERKRDLKYRVKRRTCEILKTIARYSPHPRFILDLGTAEGRMLETVQINHPSSLCVGVDYSLALLNYGAKKFPGLNLIRADIQNLNFLEGERFDVIIAAAVFEHLVRPQKMLSESYRLLQKNGILIITSPHPFWERIARCLGKIKGDHPSVMNSESIFGLCEKVGLSFIEKRGFMLTPSGVVGEEKLEGFLAQYGLDRYFPNQLIVVKK